MFTLDTGCKNNDAALLASTIGAVTSAGNALKQRFSTKAPLFRNRSEIISAVHANDAVALGFLREQLAQVRPQARWVDDEFERGALPPGEWWVVDPVEGNINHVHGMTEWCVTATLVQDNVSLLSVVYLPMTEETYTAVRGCGAWLNGSALRASAKTDLDTALVGTGQAEPNESRETFRRIAHSVEVMLNAGSVMRVSVPSTLQLIQVAAGRTDAFWQFSRARAGLLAGALLVAEAGGTLSDTHGKPWTPESHDFLAAAPGLHSAAAALLSTIC